MMYENYLEKREIPFHNYEEEDGYNLVAQRICDKLFSLLDVPYTADESSDDNKVAAVINLKPAVPGAFDFDSIAVKFLEKDKHFPESAFIKVEIREEQEGFDKVTEVTFHFANFHYIIISTPYEVSKDADLYKFFEYKPLRMEVDENYLFNLETLIDNCVTPSRENIS